MYHYNYHQFCSIKKLINFRLKFKDFVYYFDKCCKFGRTAYGHTLQYIRLGKLKNIVMTYIRMFFYNYYLKLVTYLSYLISLSNVSGLCYNLTLNRLTNEQNLQIIAFCYQSLRGIFLVSIIDP